MYFIKPTDPNPITPAKAVLLGMLCLTWLGTGLVGHDPWKPDEAYSFGLIYSILQSGDWLVPAIAGEPFMDKPPLYYWTAALFARLFSPLLPLHDGAEPGTPRSRRAADRHGCRYRLHVQGIHLAGFVHADGCAVARAVR